MPLPLSVALSAINWALLLRETPKIVREARQLYETVSKRRAATKSLPAANTDDPAEVSEILNELKLRIEEMEAHNARQAELISQLAAQGEALSQGLETLAGRMAVMAWITVSAILLAAGALAVALLN